MRKETLEETIDKASLLEFPIKEWYRSDDYNREEITAARDGFKRGAKWQQERSYSEEEVIRFADWILHKRFEMRSDNHQNWWGKFNEEKDYTSKELFEQFKKK